MKQLFIGLLALGSISAFAEQNTLRDEFIHARKATFRDIHIVKPETPKDYLYASLKCPERNLELVKLGYNDYYDAGSVVSNYYINFKSNELVGTDEFSEKTKVIRISNKGTAIIEFSTFRTRRERSDDGPKSVVFPELTVTRYTECSL